MNKFKLAFAVAVLSLSACTKPAESVRLLEDLGYTEIRIKGYGWFSCHGDSDFYHTKFIATSPAKKEVKGVVCRGFWFKNNTVRWG